jgi:hypothetical protein
MIPRTAGLGLFVILTACAAHRNVNSSTLVLREKSPGLFVGHSQDGEVVIAASHYDAMNGLAVVDTDLGLPSRKDTSGAMICRREMPTGTHVPRWACRYTDDLAHERQLTLNMLQQPMLSPNIGGSQGMSVSQGNGTASHTQQR